MVLNFGIKIAATINGSNSQKNAGFIGIDYVEITFNFDGSLAPPGVVSNELAPIQRLTPGGVNVRESSINSSNLFSNINRLSASISGLGAQQQGIAPVNVNANPAQAIGFAVGGPAFAPRGTDTVPAMLTPGEFVVNRNAAQQNLPLLKSINSGKTSYLAEGGEVGALDKRIKASEEVMNIWFKEQLCLTGHLAIWKEVMSKHKGAVAVFEHDAIVKRNFLDVDVNDGEWVFLGYRVDHRDDYECVDDPFEKIKINKFEGTHGYALTPNTAKSCLDALDKFDQNRGYLPLGVSIDHMMGVTNAFNVELRVVDPSPCIAAIEEKKSYTQPEEKTARYNMIPPDKTLMGIVNHEKYKMDYKNNWMVF
jgi:GR25 family glycosyltransferase involved in LPS biosynthesis